MGGQHTFSLSGLLVLPPTHVVVEAVDLRCLGEKCLGIAGRDECTVEGGEIDFGRRLTETLEKPVAAATERLDDGIIEPFTDLKIHPGHGHETAENLLNLDREALQQTGKPVVADLLADEFESRLED